MLGNLMKTLLHHGTDLIDRLLPFDQPTSLNDTSLDLNPGEVCHVIADFTSTVVQSSRDDFNHQLPSVTALAPTEIAH